MFRSSAPRPTEACERAMRSGMAIGPTTGSPLVFLPGFMVSPTAYRALLTPLADQGWRVLVPALYRRGPAALVGRVPPATEAGRAAALIETVSADRGPCPVGGHSRGGYAAWLAAARVPVAGLLLVDPVSGGGPPWARPTPPTPPAHPVATLVVGTALGGRCAPAGRNHEQFAASTSATHVVVPDCGHADVLDDRWARLGRHLCGGGDDPAAARARVAEALLAFTGPAVGP